jgi:hypothetical protein
MGDEIEFSISIKSKKHRRTEMKSSIGRLKSLQIIIVSKPKKQWTNFIRQNLAHCNSNFIPLASGETRN